jgi:iron complex transport system substrate-binding protein
MSEADDVAGHIIGAAMRIRRGMGPDRLESVHEVGLAARLSRCGLRVERQKSAEFEFDGIRFDRGFRLDLMAEELVADAVVAW